MADKLTLVIEVDDKGTPVVREFYKTLKKGEETAEKAKRRLSSFFETVAKGTLIYQGLSRDFRKL